MHWRYKEKTRIEGKNKRKHKRGGRKKETPTIEQQNYKDLRMLPLI